MPVFENKRAKASHGLIPVMLLRGETKLDSSIITFTWNISTPGFLFLDYKAIPQRGGNKKNQIRLCLHGKISLYVYIKYLLFLQ